MAATPLTPTSPVTAGSTATAVVMTTDEISEKRDEVKDVLIEKEKAKGKVKLESESKRTESEESEDSRWRKSSGSRRRGRKSSYSESQSESESDVEEDRLRCKLGRLDEAVKDALKLLGEMTDRGLIPDAYCYNVMIKGFCDMGLLDEARNGLVCEAQQIFNEMEKLGCFPSVVTFHALIHGLCKTDQLEAHMLFYKMEMGRNASLFLRLSQGSNRVLDSGSLQKMVEQLCESGLILKAYKILMQLADSGVVQDMYDTLINGFCKAGNINGSLKLFNDMQLKGLSPDSVTYQTLIIALQRVDGEKDAFIVFDQVLKWGNLPGRDKEALKAIEEHFKKGELDKAIRGLLEMDLGMKDFDLAPYTILLIGLCRAKRADEAIVFNVLEKRKINFHSPKLCEFDLWSLWKKVDLAIDVFHYTLEKGFFVDATNLQPATQVSSFFP
ncbi:hypothetical protein FNV43_RR02591 [Rhamnella rubrinervis]|uniref:Pentatricopeptide repeat-containing protein n=1 Tax=Rhamnella rubrinervis TaxID=2594499 RepID=A0A8K0HSF3_9ROSA|nr:hypothetical protein FNV43_RR02591 [Rhamnella rubrinervis]